MLNSDRRELTRGSKAIAPEPQVFDLLRQRARDRERVVTKDDVRESAVSEWAQIERAKRKPSGSLDACAVLARLA